ncbi:MAG: hypothetical protein IPI65_02510 [Bacteroidetes bacterium]|nr:hypothetical protein [Bacteroidota bacterium]
MRNKKIVVLFDKLIHLTEKEYYPGISLSSILNKLKKHLILFITYPNEKFGITNNNRITWYGVIIGSIFLDAWAFVIVFGLIGTATRLNI